MSDDQKNPPAQPEFGELAPEGWSWNPEANAPHTPETLKAAEVAAKAAAKAKAAHAAATAAAINKSSAPKMSQPKVSAPKVSQPKVPRAKKSQLQSSDTPENSENLVTPEKAPRAAKAKAAIFVAPAASDQTVTSQNPSEDEKKNRAVALAKLASDRFITWGLLGVAVFSVLTGLGDYVNLRQTINAAFDQLNEMQPGLNLEPYADFAFAQALGWGIVFTQAIVIGLTFWWAIRRMRAGKMAFWVPVVGFAVSSAVVLGFMLVAFTADTAAWTAILTYIQNTAATTTPGQNS
jgi:hypothetical protein